MYKSHEVFLAIIANDKVFFYKYDFNVDFPVTGWIYHRPLKKHDNSLRL